jgi:hypothetical protein
MGGSKINSEVKGRLDQIFKLLQEKNLAEAERNALTLRGEIGNSEYLQRAISMIDRIKVLGR